MFQHSWFIAVSRVKVALPVAGLAFGGTSCIPSKVADNSLGGSGCGCTAATIGKEAMRIAINAHRPARDAFRSCTYFLTLLKADRATSDRLLARIAGSISSGTLGTGIGSPTVCETCIMRPHCIGGVGGMPKRGTTSPTGLPYELPTGGIALITADITAGEPGRLPQVPPAGKPGSPGGMSISTKTSKKLSAGKSTPGVCCFIRPEEARVGLSLTMIGPRGEGPVRVIEIISVSMYPLPSRSTRGSPLWIVVGPDATKGKGPGPPIGVSSIIIVAVLLKESKPAGG